MKAASHITSRTTTSIVASTVFVSQVVIACVTPGTSNTLKVTNGEATAKTLIPVITLTAPSAGPIIISFDKSVLMTTGVKVVTAGATNDPTVDVFIEYETHE
jgi:hypothetical protein